MPVTRKFKVGISKADAIKNQLSGNYHSRVEQVEYHYNCQYMKLEITAIEYANGTTTNLDTRLTRYNGNPADTRTFTCPASESYKLHGVIEPILGVKVEVAIKTDKYIPSYGNVVNVDEVNGLSGRYIILSAVDQSSLDSLISQLGLQNAEVVAASYATLLLQQ